MLPLENIRFDREYEIVLYVTLQNATLHPVKYCLLKAVLHNFLCSLLSHLFVLQSVTFSSIFPKEGCLTSEIEKISRAYFENTVMNVTESRAGCLIITCPLNEMV